MAERIKYPIIRCTPKTGGEPVLCEGRKIACVQDYWRWAHSELNSNAERGKDGDEQRLAARRVPVLRRGLIRRIVLPAGHGRVVCPGIVLRLGFIVPVVGGGAVLPAGREMLPVSIIRRRGCILLILRREDFIL